MRARLDALMKAAVKEGFGNGEAGVRDCTTSCMRVLGFWVRRRHGTSVVRSPMAIDFASVPNGTYQWI